MTDFAPSVTDAVSPWVARFAPLIAAGGEVLDVASGTGRHARHLQSLGHPVLALDRDASALAALAGTAGPGVTTLVVDLEAAGAVWPVAADRFAGIVVTNYLHRPLFADIAASLAPGGVLIYETFSNGNADFGKPSNPDFLLAPGELLALAVRFGLTVVAYEDGHATLPKQAMVQRLCAVKADFPRNAMLLGAF